MYVGKINSPFASLGYLTADCNLWQTMTFLGRLFYTCDLAITTMMSPPPPPIQSSRGGGIGVCMWCTCLEIMTTQHSFITSMVGKCVQVLSWRSPQAAISGLDLITAANPCVNLPDQWPYKAAICMRTGGFWQFAIPVVSQTMADSLFTCGFSWRLIACWPCMTGSVGAGGWDFLERPCLVRSCLISCA